MNRLSSSEQLIFGTGLSSNKDFQSLFECCSTAIENGIKWFDTAPSYKTEEIVGKVLREISKRKGIRREEFRIQTKIDPIQMYQCKVEQHVSETLMKMGLDYFDCLLIHWPVYKYLRQTWQVMEKLKIEGVVKKIGICNVRRTHLEELKGIGILPDIIQIERHPLNTFEAERCFCKANDIMLQAYSPLCKMHPRLIENSELKHIATLHNCGIGEIILCWHIQTGDIPVFTTTKPSRLKNYTQLDTIQLNDNEIAKISAMNINHKLYLESLICPGF